MAALSLKPLPENAGLAFRGEPIWRGGALQPGQARTLWTTTNPSGRDNSEVIRCFLGVGDAGMMESWQVDFPPHLTGAEAALFVDPFGLLESRAPVTPEGNRWDNPHRQDELRRSLARLERYLATPRTWPAPHWNWIEGAWLPDDSLLAVARDDDFTSGVLRSRYFTAWWEHCSPPHASALVINSFPFPWAPGTPLSTLTGLQQDLRFAVARAARAENQTEIDQAVATAYGWPGGIEQLDATRRLVTLYQRRLG